MDLKGLGYNYLPTGERNSRFSAYFALYLSEFSKAKPILRLSFFCSVKDFA